MGIIRDNAWIPSFMWPCNSRWDRLLRLMRERNWNLTPDYQRPACWTTEQQRQFIAFMLEGGSCPPLYVYSTNKTNARPEVIDGQQRIRAIQAFVEEGLLVTLSYGITVCWDDLDDADKRFTDITYCLGDLSRADRLRWYLRVNGGVPHTEAELLRVAGLLAAEHAKGTRGSGGGEGGKRGIVTSD